jgi:hypothetical protein
MIRIVKNTTKPLLLSFLLSGSLFFVAAGTGARPASEKQKDKNNKAVPAAGILSPDKGKFRILLEGKVIGNEDFELAPSGDTWMARDSTSAHAPDGTEIKASGQLRLSADGTPLHYEWTAQTKKKASGVVDFSGGKAKSSIDLGAKAPFLQEFTFSSPRVAVLDNNLYYQYGILALLYDRKTGGKQDFPVLIPQDSTPGSISVAALGDQQIEGEKYEALRVSSTDLEILIYLDKDHHLARLEVPSSKVSVVRE